MRNRVAARLHLFPEAEAIEPEFVRGEVRLAAEVLMAGVRGEIVPRTVHARALNTLTQLAG